MRKKVGVSIPSSGNRLSGVVDAGEAGELAHGHVSIPSSGNRLSGAATIFVILALAPMGLNPLVGESALRRAKPRAIVRALPTKVSIPSSGNRLSGGARARAARRDGRQVSIPSSGNRLSGGCRCPSLVTALESQSPRRGIGSPESR